MLPDKLTPEMVERITKKLPAAQAAELISLFDELEERKQIGRAHV